MLVFGLNELAVFHTVILFRRIFLNDPKRRIKPEISLNFTEQLTKNLTRSHITDSPLPEMTFRN